MGKLSTLEGFKLDLITDTLNPPEGFSIRAETRENMILIFVEDLRGHPDFETDKSAGGWPDILKILSGIGLDPAKAVVSLGFRTEAVSSKGGETFNIGVAQLGWACATAHDPLPDRVPEPVRVPASRLDPVPNPAQERAHLLHKMLD